ncbi:MAG TPA: sugar ABC transporter ATP-binding protein [Fibrobacteria bacterium]|nr:sugar ABC transporter ATP-binding protein [Fibrobacteria bacterium]
MAGELKGAVPAGPPADGRTLLHPRPLLRLRGVRKAFGAAQALQGVDLEIAPGEVHALVGENGAGKSTLMSILGGSLAPDGGTMEFLGAPYRPPGPAQAGNLGVSLVHQELALAPHLDVESNICLGREASRLGFLKSQGGRVREALERLGYGHLDPRTRVGDLGTAERQIVEIARALFQDARLILMDEPTSSLPARDAENLFGAIARLKARGVSVVYISHFLEETARVADRITVLRDGRTAAAGLPASTPQRDILAAMVGRPVTEIFPSAPRTLGDTLLSVRGWISRPGAAPAAFDLRRGQILGLAGLVGSGRSSLLRGLAGLGPRIAGEMGMPGVPPRDMGGRIGFLSEDRKEEGLALNLSVRANATLSVLGRFRGPGGLLRRDAETAAVREVCAALQVRYRDPEQAVGALSGGNQQKVALSRLLLGRSEVWLLDEPTRGVDVGAKAEIYRLISRAAAEGKAVLWAGSYLPELFGVCDSLAVLHRGKLSPVRPVGRWTEAEVMAWATSGAGRP